MDETEYTEMYHSKQIAYCPSKTTTVLCFGTATCFRRFRPSSGYQYVIASTVKNVCKIYTPCRIPQVYNIFFFLVESFGLLNDLFPLPSILDAGYPVFDLHLADVLFGVILPSVLGSSL